MEIEIGWEDIELTIGGIIGRKMPMEEGVRYLNEQLYQQTGFYLLQDADTNRLEAEWNDWMVRMLATQPLPGHIQSIYFGLFTISDPRYNSGAETTATHFMGSSSQPDDDDWSCEQADSFLPESGYRIFTDFSLLDAIIKDKEVKGNADVLLFTGLLSLLVINNIEKHSEILLRTSLFSTKESWRDSLHVGCGFDAGDIFIAGKITGNGLL